MSTTTKAKSTKGVNLAVKLTGDTWTPLSEVKSVPEIGQTSERIDVTSLESDMKVYIADIPDYSGDLEFTMNAIPTGEETSNYDVLVEIDPDDSHEWRVQYPQLGVECTITAQCQWRMGAGEVSAAQDIIATLIPQSAPAWATIASQSTLNYAGA